jgi:thioredoxin reductase
MPNEDDGSNGGGLRNALRKLGEAIEDLSELHVRTMSGSINVTTGTEDTDSDGGAGEEDGDSGKVDMSAMKALAENQDVEIVADTVIKFDGDAYYFINDDAPKTLIDAHQKAVETSMKSRQAIVEMFKDQLL